jgi:hypothetical protein
MRNAGTIPEVVHSAPPGEVGRLSSAVRPTPAVRLRWWTGENLVHGVLSCGRFPACGLVRRAGFAR